MKLKIEIPDEDEDWVCHREIPLTQLQELPELLVAYDQSVVLPGGEVLRVSAHYGKHNGLSIITVQEGGEHKASIEARYNDPPPQLIFTISKKMCVRMTVLK
jgi:hypothetical protein